MVKHPCQSGHATGIEAWGVVPTPAVVPREGRTQLPSEKDPALNCELAKVSESPTAIVTLKLMNAEARQNTKGTATHHQAKIQSCIIIQNLQQAMQGRKGGPCIIRRNLQQTTGLIAINKIPRTFVASEFRMQIKDVGTRGGCFVQCHEIRQPN